VTLSSPDHEIDRAISFEQHDGKALFLVPSVQIYEIASVELVSKD